jgi:hypothetical protein
MLAADSLPLEKPEADAIAEMPLMMLALGIEPDLLRADHPALYASMSSVCAGCGSKDTCRGDLAGGEAARRHVDYCGNAATLSLLAGREDLAVDR